MLYISAEIRIFILSLLPRHLFSNPMKDFSTKNAPLSQVVTFSPSSPAIHRYNESSPGQVFSETERFKELCVLSKENAWLSFFAMAHFLTMRRVPDKRFCVSSQNVAPDPPEIPWVHKSSHKQRLAGFSLLTAQVVRKLENLLECNSWCTRSLLVPRRVDCSKWQVWANNLSPSFNLNWLLKLQKAKNTSYHSPYDVPKGRHICLSLWIHTNQY